MAWFLERVVPVAERLGVRLCCNPDDPPWALFGLPRIMSTEADYLGGSTDMMEVNWAVVAEENRRRAEGRASSTSALALFTAPVRRSIPPEPWPDLPIPRCRL